MFWALGPAGWGWPLPPEVSSISGSFLDGWGILRNLGATSTVTGKVNWEQEEKRFVAATTWGAADSIYPLEAFPVIS